MNVNPDSLEPARILVVDDERLDRQVLEVMLAPEGYIVLSAASGQEALAMLAQQAPDLILLDVMMPLMDGYQLARLIKKDPATKNIPIIMVTALNDRQARLLGLEAGAEDFLSRPLDREELCVRVRNLLRLKAYGDYHDKYSQLLEDQVSARTAELREERDRSQRYLDTATVMLLALDTQGRLTLANRFACTVLGSTEFELLGHDWFDTCLAPAARDRAREQFRNLLGGGLSAFENTIETRSGYQRLIEWRGTLLRDEAQRITGTLISGTDITERHQAVEALRITEERMRFALEAAGVGIWDWDITTGVLQWSAILEAQYGLRSGAFDGTFAAFLEAVHPQDRDALAETMAQARRSGGDFCVEHRVIRSDGAQRWMSSAGRFQLADDGQPLRGIGISQDITERRSLERQQQQGQKMEAVGQLASGVAHDFNNLLTVILGFGEIMSADDVLADRYGTDLGEIVLAARRASSLTKQLLAFGRQQVLNIAPLDLNLLITDMTGMLGRLIGEHIEISLELASHLSPALADRGQLEQVLMNLLVNARDAMPSGGSVIIETKDVELVATSFPEAAVVPGPYIMLAVSDTGCGMSEETRRHIFEPFFTTKEVGKGTGLGLSTTYGIVKQSRGYIWATSEVGLGTTFKVYLPQSTGDVPLKAAAPAVPAPVERASETVLLVEDEASVRHISKRFLDKAGYRVLEAASGDEAETLFAQHADTIDLVVTDMSMPGCSGPDSMTRLQARAPDLRVLYMSGYTAQTASHRLGIDNGEPFVQKPFTSAELARQVRRALDK